MYKLRLTLLGHTLDVRGVTAVSDSCLVSGSRDGTARAWDLAAVVDTLQDSAVCFLSPTKAFVNCVAAVRTAEGSLVACGGKDAVIYLAEPAESFAKPGDDYGVYQLPGHAGNVCALAAYTSPETGLASHLVLALWDGTARVWDLATFQETHTLAGHAASVWDAQLLDPNTVLTCSADKTIRLWVNGALSRTYTGHADVVRKLLPLPGGRFALALNDCTIKVWDIALGAVLATLNGHTLFIYDLALLPSGEIVSTGEDRTVRVWRDLAIAQVLTLPCTSAWAVTALPNGDLAVAGSDGTVYLFSAEPRRQATPAAIEALDQQVRLSAIAEQSLDNLRKTDIPGYDRLDRPGAEEGQTVMVKSAAGVIEAHQWSGGQWVKIGDVVSGATGGNSTKTEYEGKEYDYVFDVDIEDGKPPLKLPYNATDNPYTAAEAFLARYNLPSSYTDEVVRFISKNTSGFELGMSLGAAPAVPEPAAPAQPPAAHSMFPQTTPIAFKDFKASQLGNGFEKFNAAQADSFDASVVAQVKAALERFESKDAMFLLTKIVPVILGQWERTDRLIGLDLLRIAIARATTVDLIQSLDTAEAIFKMVVLTLEETTDQDVTLFMMTCKVLCNLTTSTLFSQITLTVDGTETAFNEYFEELCLNFAVVVKVMTSSEAAGQHKHYRMALGAAAAFTFNVLVFVATGKVKSSAAKQELASLLADVGGDLIGDEEAAYRVTVAVGNSLSMGGGVMMPSWVEDVMKLYHHGRFEPLLAEIAKF